jgi:hypothetical protein
MRSAQVAFPATRRFLLSLGRTVQDRARRFDLEWLRRVLHLSVAVYPWTIEGFFRT